MPTFRETLIRVMKKNNRIMPGFLPQLKIEKITKEIEQKYSRSENPPESVDLQKIRDIFLEADKNNTWNEVDQKIWRKACWVLWCGDNYLAANKIFLEKYFEYCKNNVSSRIIKSLISAYLKDFKSGIHGQAEVANFIRSNLSAERFKALLPLWVERDANYAIFDVNKDFCIYAADYIASQAGASNYLAHLGLDGQLETANFSQKLFESVASEIENIISKSPIALDLFYKLKDIALLKDNTLRYPQKKYVLIESLLRPWKEKTPPVDLSRAIIEFLLKLFLDPRTMNGRDNWVGVSKESLGIIRKWLANKTLEQFFEIIKKTAKDDHWQARHKFWKSYYDSGYIDDAWVALGKDSRSEAKFHSTDGNELMAASVKGSGVKADHSVLIFKVGGLTICEWSHNGKCRIWLESNKDSPKLYEDSYQAEQLRQNEDLGIAHQTSWQFKVANHIQFYTGIRRPIYKNEVI